MHYPASEVACTYRTHFCDPLKGPADSVDDMCRMQTEQTYAAAVGARKSKDPVVHATRNGRHVHHVHHMRRTHQCGEAARGCRNPRTETYLTVCGRWHRNARSTRAHRMRRWLQQVLLTVYGRNVALDAKPRCSIWLLSKSARTQCAVPSAYMKGFSKSAGFKLLFNSDNDTLLGNGKRSRK